MDPETTTLAERWDMIEKLTVEEWAKKGIDVRALPVNRKVGRLIRRLPDGTEQVIREWSEDS